MSTTVNVHEAKTQLSRLLERARQGEDVVIARHGTPVARLVAISDRPARRSPGGAKGKITLSPEFDEPLPEEVLDSFER